MLAEQQIRDLAETRDIIMTTERKRALASTQKSREVELKARKEEEMMNLTKGHGLSMAQRLQALSSGKL